MLPSFYPAIEENDDDMNELKNNYAYSFRNKPGIFITVAYGRFGMAGWQQL